MDSTLQPIAEQRCRAGRAAQTALTTPPLQGTHFSRSVFDFIRRVKGISQFSATFQRLAAKHDNPTASRGTDNRDREQTKLPTDCCRSTGLWRAPMPEHHTG